MTASVQDCIFCKIARREIPAKEVFRDDDVVAFRDLNPQAPTHVLVAPTRHAENLSDFVANVDARSVKRLFEVAADLGKSLGNAGYRIVTNEGPDGGQTVGHLHVHVLAGRHMTWPPG
jgi:histidine triad (HIT) family protein